MLTTMCFKARRKQVFRKNLPAALLLLLLISLNQAVAQTPLSCGSKLQGILSLSYECLNDTIMLQTDPNASSWHYAKDSHNDYTGSTAFEYHGMGWNETESEIYIGICGNNTLEGKVISGALNGTVSHGDLFLNFGANDFLTASNNRELHAIRFTKSNDSGAPELGVYKNVKAKSVTAVNQGHKTLQAYENYFTNRPAALGYGDLPVTQTYYAKTISLNEIENGTYLGPITLLNATELAQQGFDRTRVCGTATTVFGIKLSKFLIVDPCGVIGGDGSSCRDCSGLICGSTKVDQCGICGGDNTACLDCNGNIFGGAQVDQCGVCGGDGQSCLDCKGVPNGSSQVDQCGVCGGDGQSCLDCKGLANGGNTVDVCGVCGGDGSSCLDCKGVPNGGAVVDSCGVCGGDGKSCTESGQLPEPAKPVLDCNGVPNGTAVLDQCGVCGGNGTSCLDCDGVPNGSNKPDSCGLCKSSYRSCATDRSKVSATDADGDGLSNSFEGSQDSDGDGIPNSQDLDSDGDGIPDCVEAETESSSQLNPAQDKDNDGIPNYLDRDSDNDGLIDGREAYDLNNDLVIDVRPSGKDQNRNGLDDAFEQAGLQDNLSCGWQIPICPDGCFAFDIRDELEAVNASADELANRARGYAAKAAACENKKKKGKKKNSAQASLQAAETRLNQFALYLKQGFKPIIIKCPTGLCPNDSKESVLAGLNSQLDKLYLESLNSRKAYEKACGIKTKPVPKGKKNKSNAKGREALKKAKASVANLPKNQNTCS